MLDVSVDPLLLIKRDQIHIYDNILQSGNFLIFLIAIESEIYGVFFPLHY